MSELKPIETVYSGYRFRSRLEARWAVYFDALGIEYEYEIEGYQLGRFDLGKSPVRDLGWYLPDFWLPQVRMWAEVKPDRFTELEAMKCEALAKGTGWPCLLLEGPPALRNYWAYECGWGAEQEPEEADYLLFGTTYWIDEGRFFGCTGADVWQIEDYSRSADSGARNAVNASRRARFDRRVR